MAAKKKRLTKSKKDKVITGLIGGVGEYINIDPTLLRITWIVFIAITGFVPGVIAYFVGSFIVPEGTK